nr:hypothetical protein [Tanacetum cinerariifolium]
SPPQEKPTTTFTSNISLLNTLPETYTTLSHKVAALEQDKVAQALEILKLKKKLENQRRSKSSSLKRLRKVAKKARLLDEQMAKRLHNEEVEQVAAREKQEKDDSERMQEKHLDNIRKYQSLKRKLISVAQARKNMIAYLKNMAGYKIAHFKGMTYDQVRQIIKREYNKVQAFLKPDGDEEPAKKRGVEETLLQESFKKLRAEVEVLMAEFKVKALQVKYHLIDWDTHSEGSRSYSKIIRVGGITQAYQSFGDMLKDFDREDLDALWRLVKEKQNDTAIEETGGITLNGDDYAMVGMVALVFNINCGGDVGGGRLVEMKVMRCGYGGGCGVAVMVKMVCSMRRLLVAVVGMMMVSG